MPHTVRSDIQKNSRPITVVGELGFNDKVWHYFGKEIQSAAPNPEAVSDQDLKEMTEV